MRRQKFLLFVLVAGMALLLGGCGVNHEGVDLVNTAPSGIWQTLVVWPLGRSLIWIDNFLQAANIPHHWGFAIIAFTLFVKVVTFPLTVSQIRGMQAQKDLQPKIQELQKKYGKDREKLSREQMKLYQEAGVNPLSGCLPLVIQMPVLIGLYSALIALGPSLEDASFFWIPNLAFPRYTAGLSWISEAFQVGDYQMLGAYLFLPVLLVISQLFMQKWMTPPTPSTGDNSNPMAGMSKQLMFMMTFMFGFFTLQVPAGLTLYWVTSNGLQMLQQWAITSDKLGFAASTKPAAASTVEGTATAVDDESTDEPPAEGQGEIEAANGDVAGAATPATGGSNGSNKTGSKTSAAKNKNTAGSTGNGAENAGDQAAKPRARRRRAKRR